MNAPQKKTQIIKYEALQSFVANFFVAMNFPGAFAWNEVAIKRAFTSLMQENDALRQFGPALLSNHCVADAPDSQHPPYQSLFRWFRDDCLDVVDARRDLVKLNDDCLRFAHEHRAQLSDQVLAAIKEHGQTFFQRTQLPNA